MIYNNAMELVGGTPLLKVNGFDAKNRAQVYIKLEKMNPAGSTKDRAALGMIEDAERTGILKKGSVIIEPTSGNTGIGLAMLGRLKGYRVIIVMPSTMSEERRSLIKAYGAELILTDGTKGMKGAIAKAQELKDEMGDKAYIPQQFNNPANPKKHYETTAKEVFTDLPDLDAFVVGVGTGGTISGFGQYIKDFQKETKVYGVEPEESAVLSGENPGPHKIQGIGAGFIPGNYHEEFVDAIIKVNTQDAMETAKTFSQNEGVLIGISAGANLFAALSVAKKLGPDKTVVTIAPDGGEKYLSMGLFD